METINSRVFMSGNSQAVRIPHCFKLSVNEVSITRTPDGGLLLRPIVQDRGAQLQAILQDLDDEFIEILEQSQKDKKPPQEREDL